MYETIVNIMVLMATNGQNNTTLLDNVFEESSNKRNEILTEYQEKLNLCDL